MARDNEPRKKINVSRTTTVRGRTFFSGRAEVNPEDAEAIAAAAKRLKRVKRQVDDEPLGTRTGAKKGKAKDEEDKIPADFPSASVLGSDVNQITGFSELEGLTDEDLMNLSGIDDAKAAEIREALDARTAGVEE